MILHCSRAALDRLQRALAEAGPSEDYAIKRAWLSWIPGGDKVNDIEGATIIADEPDNPVFDWNCAQATDRSKS